MTADPKNSQPGTVAIIGGGLAGLSAGCALADAGYRVELFERRPYLGGRASSYELPGTGEVVDNCQHVLLGCCTNLIDFYRRLLERIIARNYDVFSGKVKLSTAEKLSVLAKGFWRRLT